MSLRVVEETGENIRSVREVLLLAEQLILLLMTMNDAFGLLDRLDEMSQSKRSKVSGEFQIILGAKLLRLVV